MDLDAHERLREEVRMAHDWSVPDGPVVPARYAAAPIRILWILREVVDDRKERWDLSQFLNGVAFDRTRTRWRTYGLVAKLSHGLLRGGTAAGIATMPPVHARDTLRDIAVINLKKVGGGSTVDWKVFGPGVRDWAQVVEKQIDYLDPSIVVLGGTASDLSSLPRSTFARDEDYPTQVVRSAGRVWTRMYHPAQMRIKQEVLVGQVLEGLSAVGWSR